MRDKKTFAILITIIAMLAIVIGILAFVLISRSGGSSKSSDSSSYIKKSEAEVEAAIIENEALQSAAKSAVDGLNQYQANNRGSVPTINGSGAKGWDYFIKNYLDVDMDGNETGFSSKYKLVPCSFNDGECKSPKDLKWEEDKNIIYAAQKAVCGKEGLEKTNGSRIIAFYVALNPDEANDGSKNAYYCISN